MLRPIGERQLVIIGCPRSPALMASLRKRIGLPDRSEDRRI
jgi:hypothetical protein